MDYFNYKEYTLEQLYDARRNINGEKYPDRLTELENEIKRKESDPEIQKEILSQREKKKYRTFWPRFWAGLIDGLVLLPLDYIDHRIWLKSSKIPSLIILLWFLFNSLSFVTYSVLMHGYLGQTLGKMVCRVKVFDISEGRLRFKQAIRRDIVPIILILVHLPFLIPTVFSNINPFDQELSFSMLFFGSIIFLWFLLEMITMFSNEKRRALHDYIAGSIVIRI